jgi:hypothetical protein
MKLAWLEVVSPPADRESGHPGQCQDRAEHDHDVADRSENGYFGDETRGLRVGRGTSKYR